MTNIFPDITATVGRTPLVRINRMITAEATVLAKVEAFNPASSVKDRVGVAIVDAAEECGALQPGGTIVEATSGNTGVALAMVGAARGYHVVIVMPASMSRERRTLMKALGAELILTDPTEGMEGAVAGAKAEVEKRPGAILASQFTNVANPRAHYRGTGVEIWEATDGEVDILVAGVGTGGTISGAGRALKERKASVKTVAVEPAESPMLTEGVAGPHGIQGIGANFVPKNYDGDQVDEVVTVTSQEALEYARRAAAEEGLFVGISAGAALAVADKIASRPQNAGRTIVAILPDTGERYLSTPLWAGLVDEE